MRYMGGSSRGLPEGDVTGEGGAARREREGAWSMGVRLWAGPRMAFLRELAVHRLLKHR